MKSCLFSIGEVEAITDHKVTALGLCRGFLLDLLLHYLLQLFSSGSRLLGAYFISS